MFVHTEESLMELEDYINQLDTNVGLSKDTLDEITNAISKERTKLLKLSIAGVIVSGCVHVFDEYAFDRTGAECCANCGDHVPKPPKP